MFCLWGRGVELLIDPLSLALNNQVRMFANLLCDVRCTLSRRVRGYCAGDGCINKGDRGAILAFCFWRLSPPSGGGGKRSPSATQRKQSKLLLCFA
jgi:hypothetical protein